MLEAKQLRNHALECLRLQTDCMELASVAHSHDVRSHFAHMARFWGALAVSGPNSNAGPESLDAEAQAT
jgi:hypothetical protein